MVGALILGFIEIGLYTTNKLTVVQFSCFLRKKKKKGCFSFCIDQYSLRGSLYAKILDLVHCSM
jgi:hypothetical protein